jgi:redox-sensitive bicupin YhaK (pirin superfamily)
MEEDRVVQSVIMSRPTLEGAGVNLNRAFGFHEKPNLDPFLLLDDFHSRDPRDYQAGFPWHPHRGIETITYMFAGTVEHGDSLGNSGTIRPGGVQWMTAGSGIIHQEMPKGDGNGEMWGFQLWANLPRTHKMIDPRYRELTRDGIPEVRTPEGCTVRIIAGRFADITGPVKDVVIGPEYLDVDIPPGVTFRHPCPRGRTAFAYVARGSGDFGAPSPQAAGARNLVVFGDGEGIAVGAGDAGVRFLLVSGEPLREPVAWRGPIVMNTEEELETAFREYRDGTFLKVSG